MSFTAKLIFVVICAGFYFAGWLSGRIKIKSIKSQGTIRIETNEDGSRDVIRFILPLDLDEIRKEKQIIFNVEDLSQNSQG